MPNRKRRIPPAPPITLVPGETVEDYQRMRRGWFEEFPPETDVEVELVERLCERSWTLKRCERLYQDALNKTLVEQPDSRHWSPETHKYLQLIDRYRLSADRAWRAAWNDIETLRRNRVETVMHVEKLKRIVFINDRSGMARHPISKPKPVKPNQENAHVQTEKTTPRHDSIRHPGELNPSDPHRE